jgi:predicted component of type VI protein secretion system
MSATDELFWPSLYARLAPSRYGAEAEFSGGEGEQDGFGVSRFFVPFAELRAQVETELESLFNRPCLESALVGAALRGRTGDAADGLEQPFEAHPLVRASIVNYGLPALIGRSAYSLRAAEIETRLRRALDSFEPRIRPETLRVTVSTAQGGRVDPDREITFTVEGEILAVGRRLRIMISTLWAPEGYGARIATVDVGL